MLLYHHLFMNGFIITHLVIMNQAQVRWSSQFSVKVGGLAGLLSTGGAGE
jgi:hypothetical protein